MLSDPGNQTVRSQTHVIFLVVNSSPSQALYILRCTGKHSLSVEIQRKASTGCLHGKLNIGLP